MKFKTSTSFLALLCLSLLLSLSSVSGQKRKPKSAKLSSKSVSTAQPLPPPPPTPILQGSYSLIDSAGATATVKNAIEVSAKSMPWGTQGMTRSRLEKTNLPPAQWVVISYSATEITIKTDVSGTISTPSDGSFVTRGKYDVSTKWVNGNLERTYKSSDGQRVNTYSLSSDGAKLNMQVIGTRDSRPKLKRPLSYQLEYRRN